MGDLIVINGPPASGKSTMAEWLLAARPLALSLDIDAVRGMLGCWLEFPTEAGMMARRLAVEMARLHLSADRDVVVPQYLGRLELVVELEAVAVSTGARFVEVALMCGRQNAIDWFQGRSRTSVNANHRDAVDLLEQIGGIESLGAMYDAFVQVVESRPNTRRVPVRRGDIDATYRAVEAAIATK